MIDKFFFNENQNCIDFLLPDELKNIFFAKFYLKTKDGNEEFNGELLGSQSYNFNKIKIITPKQVHMTNIIYATGKNSFPARPEADGILIDKNSDTLASLRFADCTPVLIAGTSPAPWMLLLHSGFNGTLENIVFNSIKSSSVTQHLDVSNLNKVWAWIGPSICKKCYSRQENDPKTICAMQRFDKNNFLLNDKLVYFDIRAEISCQLQNIGCSKEQIFINYDCTFCNNEKYFSYRAGDLLNRMSLIAGDIKLLKHIK
ncbi:MAG: polyphenol oxidase family protein [Synergistaceae bacterium]